MISLFLGTVLSQSGTDFISYHVYSDPTSAKCNPFMMQSEYAGYITANIHGLPCFSCVEMKSGRNTIYVRAVDEGGRGFDLNLPAFCELCGKEGGFAAGGCNVNWRVVDESLCKNFHAGKTTPNCDLCPQGYTCGNPDPNFNAGVPWEQYCPSQVPLGTVTMNRCEMRIDGCTCWPPTWQQTPSAQYSYFWCAKSQDDFNNGICAGTCRNTYSDLDCAALGSGYRCFSNVYDCFGAVPSTSAKNPQNPTPTPTIPVQTVSPTPSPPTPIPSTPSGNGKTTTRCGNSWTHANSECLRDCKNELDCDAGQFCWASLSLASCNSGQTSAGKTSIRCGSSWPDANGKCGSDCSNNIDCPNGEYCWSALNTNLCASRAVSDETAEETVDSSQSEGSLTENSLFWGLIGLMCGVVVFVVIVYIIFILKKREHVDLV